MHEPIITKAFGLVQWDTEIVLLPQQAHALIVSIAKKVILI